MLKYAIDTNIKTFEKSHHPSTTSTNRKCLRKDMSERQRMSSLRTILKSGAQVDGCGQLCKLH
jgi:hypothetical protein